MSWQAVTWVLEKSKSELGTRLVLISIASHANRIGEESWPSIETIAVESRLSIRQVYRCEFEAKQIGELEIVSTPGKRNSYRLPKVKRWIEKLADTPDVDVTPDNMSPLTSCHNTPDVDVTPPLTYTTKNENVSLLNRPLTVLEPSLKSGTQKTRPDHHTTCGNVENRKNRPKTPEQKIYGDAARLIPGAVKILAEAKNLGKPIAGADVTEKLKQWAADNNLEYGHETVRRAIDVAEGRIKS